MLRNPMQDHEIRRYRKTFFRFVRLTLRNANFYIIDIAFDCPQLSYNSYRSFLVYLRKKKLKTKGEKIL